MLEKFGYVELTHPQKKMPIYIDVLAIKGIEPYVWHDQQEVETGEKDEDGNPKTKIKDVFLFSCTIVKLDDKVEVPVRERPQKVAEKMKAVMEGSDD